MEEHCPAAHPGLEHPPPRHFGRAGLQKVPAPSSLHRSVYGPMEHHTPQISELVDMDDPRAVMGEVTHIVLEIDPDFDLTPLNNAFEDVLRLFRGQFEGYRACNTQYHDLKHTTDALLAMTRLIHGGVLAGHRISSAHILLGLLCTLFHDTGYIQRDDDTHGTGAKFTLVHVERSIRFMDRYFSQHGYSREDFVNGSHIIKCTGLNTKIQDLEFASSEIQLLGKMLGTADLLGQMADHTYLKKLRYLYREFKEGDVDGYESEFDLFKRTVTFNEMTIRRFSDQFGGVDSLAAYHFKERWGIDRNLYLVAIEHNLTKLKAILNHGGDLHEAELRRDVSMR